ncbi:hypothetical protein [Actinokineospora pegani]|uniref:hypothetical protein n=1 Tax=Actinokineospora pegani TaxID=2654637 RepID=UPI0012E9F386|nr:hypothetical protein [Actinokineospora pegani]
MTGLISSEFRKTTTTSLWWALLIPAVLAGFVWAWATSASGLTSELAELSFIRLPLESLEDVTWGLIPLARGFNIASTFPMLFGALAMTTELSRRTITTTFLTAPSRLAVIGAKSAVYAVWGLVYGLFISVAASVGLLVGSPERELPSAGDWLLVVFAGLLACMLWTLLGLGFGALIGSPVGAVLVLLGYVLVVGPVLETVLTFNEDPSVALIAGALPGGAGNGITGGTVVSILLDQVQGLAAVDGTVISEARLDLARLVLTLVAGSPGAFAGWLSVLVFLGWALLALGAGWLRTKSRDIT